MCLKNRKNTQKTLRTKKNMQQASKRFKYWIKKNVPWSNVFFLAEVIFCNDSAFNSTQNSIKWNKYAVFSPLSLFHYPLLFSMLKINSYCYFNVILRFCFVFSFWPVGQLSSFFPSRFSSVKSHTVALLHFWFNRKCLPFSSGWNVRHWLAPLISSTLSDVTGYKIV